MPEIRVETLKAAANYVRQKAIPLPYLINDLRGPHEIASEDEFMTEARDPEIQRGDLLPALEVLNQSPVQADDGMPRVIQELRAALGPSLAPPPVVASESSPALEVSHLTEEQVVQAFKNREIPSSTRKIYADQILVTLVMQCRKTLQSEQNPLELTKEQVIAAAREILAAEGPACELVKAKILIGEQAENLKIPIGAITPEALGGAVYGRYSSKRHYIDSIPRLLSQMREGVIPEEYYSLPEPEDNIFSGVDTLKESNVTIKVFFLGSQDKYNKYLEDALDLFMLVEDINPQDIKPEPVVNSDNIRDKYKKVLDNKKFFEEYFQPLKSAFETQVSMFQELLDRSPGDKLPISLITDFVKQNVLGYKKQTEFVAALWKDLESVEKAPEQAACLKIKADSLAKLSKAYKIPLNKLAGLEAIFDSFVASKPNPEKRRSAEEQNTETASWWDKYGAPVIMIAGGVLGAIGLLVEGAFGKFLTAIGFVGLGAGIVAKWHKSLSWIFGVSQEQVTGATGGP